MFTIKIDKFKGMFFDRQKVMNEVDRARQKALSKIGAFIRKRSRSKIRKAGQLSLSAMSPAAREQYQRRVASAKRHGRPVPKRPLASSKPGDPPKSILGHLRQWILFGYDREQKSVVIGPAKLNGRRSNAPEVLEFGGIARIYAGNGMTRMAPIAPRPYMGPSLKEEIAAGTIPKAFANTVKGPG